MIEHIEYKLKLTGKVRGVHSVFCMSLWGLHLPGETQ